MQIPEEMSQDPVWFEKQVKQQRASVSKAARPHGHRGSECACFVTEYNFFTSPGLPPL